VKRASLAALYPIAQTYGSATWTYKDVARFLPASSQLNALHLAGYLVCVQRRQSKTNVSLWRLSPRGLAAAKVPTIYDEAYGERRLLEAIERTAWAAWKSVGDQPFLSRDLPEWARPKWGAGRHVRQVGKGPRPNQRVWQLTEEGVALGRRLDEMLRKEWGDTINVGGIGTESVGVTA